MHIKKALFFLTVFSINCFSNTYYFVPPPKWECSDPTKLSKYVAIAFVGKSKASFHPSINLASEKTEATLKEYIKAIKASYQNDRNVTLVSIGQLQNQLGGETELLEIIQPSPLGDICLLQCVTKLNEDIFVMTGAVLKEEILKFKKDFLNSFTSLKSTDNLFLEPKDKAQIDILNQKFEDLKKNKISMRDFEKHLENNYDDLGSYWKILVLKHANESITKQ